MNIEESFQSAAAAFGSGDLRQAEKLLKKIDARIPGNPAVLHLRGLVALQDKRSKHAVIFLKQAVALEPNLYRLNALGSAYSKNGDYDDALATFHIAAQQYPGDADTHFNIANTMRNAGDVEASLSHFQTAIDLAPDFADAYFNLGNAFKTLWRFDEAIQVFDRCLLFNPHDGEAMTNRGNALLSQGKVDAAIKQLDAVVKNDPGNADGHYNLANALMEKYDYDRAYASYHTACDLRPNEVRYASNFSILLKELGEVDAAIGLLEVTGRVAASELAHSNLIFCIANSPAHGPADILQEARRWNRLHAANLTPKTIAHNNTPEPERRLKIGYVSGDLRTHPVGFFMESVFESHDHENFEIHVYATNQKADDVTIRIKNHADVWHDVAALSTRTLAEAIRRESIDIIVDLSGHTGENRLLTLTRRPAPLQILGAGHFSTSGMDCIDGLISDPYETPEGSDGFYSEPLIRMPDDYICYRPPGYVPEPGPAPCLENGFITFGCFNNLAKLSEPAIALWSTILKQHANSRLLIKTRALVSTRPQQRLAALFKQNGIDGDRLLLETGLPHPQFMAEYSRVDIALDPFPYTGGLTTLEALWMGVPVVAMSGETFAARHSCTHLINAGFSAWVCQNPEQYLETAATLAGDFAALAVLRQTIRPKLAVSPILDGGRYTRNLEKVYRQMWHQWCNNAGKF